MTDESMDVCRCGHPRLDHMATRCSGDVEDDDTGALELCSCVRFVLQRRAGDVRTPEWFASVRDGLVEIAELTGWTDDLAGLPGHVGALVEQLEQARAELEQTHMRARTLVNRLRTVKAERGEAQAKLALLLWLHAEEHHLARIMAQSSERFFRSLHRIRLALDVPGDTDLIEAVDDLRARLARAEQERSSKEIRP